MKKHIKMTGPIQRMCLIFCDKIGTDAEPYDRIQAKGHHSRSHRVPDQSDQFFPLFSEKQENASRRTDRYYPVDVAGDGIKPSGKGQREQQIPPLLFRFFFSRFFLSQTDFGQTCEPEYQEKTGQGVAPSLYSLQCHIVHSEKNSHSRARCRGTDHP